MARTIRTFIAVHVNVTRSLRKVLDELAEMGRAVRPVSADGLHVTLKFLGDVPLNSVMSMAAAVDEATRDIEPFSIELRGLGAFPRPERPSVVWAGIEAAEPMHELAARLEERCALLGFAKENRPYHPHITLAYVKAKPPPGLAALLEAYAETPLGVQNVTSVNLMQSEHTRDGPKYIAMHSAELD